MENQHQKIKGYRDLSQDEIDLMNAAKELADHTGKFIKELEAHSTADIRWLAIAKTDLQKGFMSLVRSIAKPESF